MKITITDQGDSSVGIPAGTVTVDWPGLEQFIDDDVVGGRHGLRRGLADFFGAYMDGRVEVQFEDEPVGGDYPC